MYIASAPVIDDKYIYGQGKNGFQAFNKADGNLVWSIKESEPYYRISNTVPYMYEGQLIVATNKGVVDGLDEKTGEQLWSFTDLIYGEARAVLGQDERYIIIFTMNGNLVKYDIQDKKVVWRFATPGGRSYMPPILYKGLILLSSERRGIFAVDYDTGKEVFRFEYADWRSRDGLREARALQVYDDVLYLTSIDGKIHAYQIDCPQLEGRR